MNRLNQIAGLAVGCMFTAAAGAQQVAPPMPMAADVSPTEKAALEPRQFPVVQDEAHGNNLADVLAESGMVFDGVLVQKHTYTPVGMRVLVTEYTFQVHEWLKGGGAQQVTVRETGGVEPDGSGMATVHSHKLTVDGRYLVFVEAQDGLMFPMSRVLQVLDGGTTVADEQGRIAIGIEGGVLVTRARPEVNSLNYLGTSATLGLEVEEVGAPDRFSEPLGAQPVSAATPDHGPITFETIASALRAPGVPGNGRGPQGLPSGGGIDYNYCGYVTGATGARNFACWLPDNDNFNWFNSAEIDWDNLVSYTANGGWIFGYLTSGGNPIRNEAPIANNNRDNGGVPSSAQMTAGGYGSWAANGNPNGICFFWFSGGNCTRIREADVFVNPVNAADELQFRKSVVHEMGHSIGFGHEDRFVSIMVSGTWRVPPNYILSAYYNRADECLGGRAMLTAANGNGGTWTLRTWRDIATVAQAHPNYGNSADVGPNVTTLNDFNAASGEVVQIQHMFVENRGNQAYSGDVDLKIYLSSNTTISSGDHLIWSGGWGSFGANSVSNNFNLNMTIPQSVPTGDYYIGWILSAAEAELTSTNNTGILVDDYYGNYAPRTIHITQRPANNDCADAIIVGNGTTPFSTVGATTDGPSEPNCSFCCSDPQVNQDIWFRYTATCTGTVRIDLCGSSYDTKVAVYQGLCPSSAGTAIACNDDSCGLQSRTTFAATAGTRYVIRVGGYSTASGTGAMTISCGGCYADCDSNGTLNVNDFICFQSAFAAANAYADCDHNSSLNVNDFICFQSAFAAGCP